MEPGRLLLLLTLSTCLLLSGFGFTRPKTVSTDIVIRARAEGGILFSASAYGAWPTGATGGSSLCAIRHVPMREKDKACRPTPAGES